MVADEHGHVQEHVHPDEPMMTLEEVQKLVLERCGPLGVTAVPVGEALGCVLAEEVLVESDIPPFANSAMDGYAVRSADTVDGPVELRVVGILPAGSPPPDAAIGPGEALQIMTGAAMPPGADGIAIVERTKRVSDGTVRILDEIDPSTNVRPAGSDFRAGSVALPAGALIRPAQIGILASVGIVDVPVWRRPRVGVMSTGDELVEGGRPLMPGQIRDSNRPTLLGLVVRDGHEAVDLGRVADSAADVEAALRVALASCDVVLSSGGVSKGEFDFVKVVLEQLASELSGEYFELAVAIRPAKPLALAWLPRSPGSDERVAFFGLPGNPVSSIVSYEVIAAPALRYMSGITSPLTRPVRGTAAEELRASRDGRLNLLRVEAGFGPDGVLAVRSAGGQQSHQLSAMASANALAMVPSGETVGVGESVDLLIFGPLA
ncbi:MAG: gephyrin-like molybdotransferase Glp [Acidimicrobiales bacterium]